MAVDVGWGACLSGSFVSGAGTTVDVVAVAGAAGRLFVTGWAPTSMGASAGATRAATRREVRRMGKGMGSNGGTAIKYTPLPTRVAGECGQAGAGRGLGASAPFREDAEDR